MLQKEMNMIQLIESWETTSLELSQAERLINLLIAQYRRMDRDEDILIDERDTIERKALRLAELVGKSNSIDFGEHSSANDPVEKAIEFLSEVDQGV